MNIRRATLQDTPRINDLLLQVELVHHRIRPDLFRNGGRKYTDEQLAEIIADDARPIFVALDDEGKMMGYAFCMFQQHIDDTILTDVKSLYIDDLCVDETARGQHIGHALYEYVRQFAKDSGCYNLTLNVWAGNDSAQRFYQNCGFRPQKTGMEMIL